MDKRQQRVLQALRRVVHFGAANTGLIPAPVGPPAAWSPLTRQLDTVNAIITRVSDAATEQGRQATNATLAATSERSLRRTLREEMHSVTQVAQSLRKSVPGIGILKMPSHGMQVEALLKYADMLVKQAATYESVLVDHGLAIDFIVHGNELIAELKASVDGRGTARSDVVSATKQVRVGLSQGMQYLRIMDAALTKTLKSEPARLAQWKNASRITIKGVSNSASSSGTGSTVAQSPLTLATQAPATAAPAAPAPATPVPHVAAQAA